MKMKKHFRPIVVALALGAMAASLGVGATSLLTAAAQEGHAISADGKYYSDYSTIDEVIDAAGELNEELAEEGNTLLKNDGSFPLSGKEYVSVFGVHSKNLLGGGDMIMGDALRNAGFHVNPTLEAWYNEQSGGSVSSTFASVSGFDEEAGYNETNGEFNLSSSVGESVNLYNDLAVVVISRNGAEGADLPRKVGEKATAEDIANHAALAYEEDASGNKTYYKHYLMLSEAERAIIRYAKAKCDKVMIVVNSSNTMELKELVDDKEINGILWIGRPGETGLNAVGRILNGSVNPSGQLVDEWPADLTADPTWYNFGDNGQVGANNTYYDTDGTVYYVDEPVLGKVADATFTGTDYEEDIYLGYRYYETYYEDLYNTAGKEAEATEWYDKHVAFAFGEGLSYSDFKFEIDGLYTDSDCKTSLGDTVEASKFNSSVGSIASVKKLYIPVTVTNTGYMSGKQTVQIYVRAPYTKGGIEKGVHDLVGYSKTTLLQPGRSEQIIISINVQDMAAWDYSDANNDGERGDYELDAGTYTVLAMGSSHIDLSVPENERSRFDSVSFTLSETAHLHLDDFTDNELHNLFTTDDGTYFGSSKTSGFDGKSMHNSLRTADMMKDGKDAMTLMSRSDFDGTFPKVIESQTIGTNSVNGLVFTDEIYDYWESTRAPRMDSHPSEPVDTSSDGVRTYCELVDNEYDPWYLSESEFEDASKGWTQASSSEGRTISLYAKDMAGVAWDDPKWDTFLNQLTFDELTSLFTESRASTPALEAFGKRKSIDQDGPNNFNNLFQWVDEPTIAATWNTDLANKEGQIVGDMGILTGNTGWYGPGMDFHRSSFSGRNNEYYSQDGIQGGYIAAAVVKGAQAKGMNAMIKHLAFNDQETNRGGMSNMVWASEQVIRQQEIKMFQMAIQEGGAGAGMSGYGRICGIVNQSNYRLNHNLLQDEFGWHGFMITDGFLGMRWCTTIDMMMRTGYQIVYKTEPWYDMVSGTWDSEKKTVKVPTYTASTGEDGSTTYTQSGTKDSYLQWYYSRVNAKSVLYSTINSSANDNGFTNYQYQGSTLAGGTVGVSYTSSVALPSTDLGSSTATYSVEDVNSLPKGLTIASNGSISGTPTEAGTYEFTVKTKIDNVVEKSAKFSITIAEAFYLKTGSDDLSSLKVGEEFLAQFTSDVFTTEGGKYESVVYSLDESSGPLPTGISISEDGTLSGTPTEDGTFSVVIKVTSTAKNQGGGTSGGFGSAPSNNATVITFKATLVVAKADTLTPDPNTPADSSSSEEGRDSEESTPSSITSSTSSTEETNSSGGCGGAIVGSSVTLSALALGGAALLLARKKKKED